MSSRLEGSGRADADGFLHIAMAKSVVNTCRTVLIFSIQREESRVTDQRRSDRICASARVRPLQGAASNRCRRARPRLPNLRAHARPTGRRQGLSARRHARAGAGAGRRAGAAPPMPASSIPRSSSRSPRASKARSPIAPKNTSPPSRSTWRCGTTRRRRSTRCCRSSRSSRRRSISPAPPASATARLHPRDIFVTPDEARATGFGVVDALERRRAARAGAPSVQPARADRRRSRGVPPPTSSRWPPSPSSC